MVIGKLIRKYGILKRVKYLILPIDGKFSKKKAVLNTKYIHKVIK